MIIAEILALYAIHAVKQTYPVDRNDPSLRFRPGETVTWGSEATLYTVDYTEEESGWIHLTSPDGDGYLVAPQSLKRQPQNTP